MIKQIAAAAALMLATVGASLAAPAAHIADAATKPQPATVDEEAYYYVPYGYYDYYSWPYYPQPYYGYYRPYVGGLDYYEYWRNPAYW